MISEKIPFQFKLTESDDVCYFDVQEDWDPPEGKVEWKDSRIFFAPEILSSVESLVEIQNIEKIVEEDEDKGWWGMAFNIHVIGTIENITMLKLML